MRMEFIPSEDEGHWHISPRIDSRRHGKAVDCAMPHTSFKGILIKKFYMRHIYSLRACFVTKPRALAKARSTYQAEEQGDS